MNEEWRPVYEAEGWYEVSNLGRVRRVRAGKATYVGKILRLNERRAKEGHGRVCVSLQVDGRGMTRDVHVMVARAFIGPCPPKKEVNHIDGDPINNCANNLEYVTRSENIYHAYRLGLMVPHGEKHGFAKLTTDHVVVILNCTAPATVIARAFGVTPSTIEKVRRGRTWRLAARIAQKHSHQESPP